MKVVALCNKLSRSRGSKLRDDDGGDVNGNAVQADGVLSLSIPGTNSPNVSNMTSGKPAVVSVKEYNINTLTFDTLNNIDTLFQGKILCD